MTPTSITFVHVKNSMQYWINPKGILCIGMSGPALFGLSMASPWQNFKTKLGFLFSSSLFIASMDSCTNVRGLEVIAILRAAQVYSLSKIPNTSPYSNFSKNTTSTSLTSEIKEVPLIPPPKEANPSMTKSPI